MNKKRKKTFFYIYGLVLPVCPCVVSFSKFCEPDMHDLLRTSRYHPRCTLARHVRHARFPRAFRDDVTRTLYEATAPVEFQLHSVSARTHGRAITRHIGQSIAAIPPAVCLSVCLHVNPNHWGTDCCDKLCRYSADFFLTPLIARQLLVIFISPQSGSIEIVIQYNTI